MSENAYQTGRLDLPFVGRCTLAKPPVCAEWNAFASGVAVIGMPNEIGTQRRTSALRVRILIRCTRCAIRACKACGTLSPRHLARTSPLIHH
jgi:hypothetical protein